MTKKITLSTIITVILSLFGVAMFTTMQLGATTSTTPEDRNNGVEHFDTITMVAATTSDETSDGLEIWASERATVYFTRNGASDSTATSTFEIEVSPNGTDWYDYNKLVSNVTNANSEELTRVETTSIVGATSTVIVGIDLSHDVFHSVRCVTAFASTTIETTDSNICAISYIE
jgi:hypothetical protein